MEIILAVGVVIFIVFLALVVFGGIIVPIAGRVIDEIDFFASEALEKIRGYIVDRKLVRLGIPPRKY